ncbi:MAG: hypothetical protein L6R41_000683 [Letrouitia leprolyta]|nr:MAG: hypothetical protein L6R41_000683 [Letrouitia leprolyta]
MSLPMKYRTAIITGAVAAVTATGAWYGADLKTSQEARKELKKRREAPTQEMLSHLENTRNRLVAKKTSLEKKIAELEKKRHLADTVGSQE